MGILVLYFQILQIHSFSITFKIKCHKVLLELRGSLVANYGWTPVIDFNNVSYEEISFIL